MSPMTRRETLSLATAGAACASVWTFAPRAASAADRVIKVGTLKLIHGVTPYFYEKFAPAG
jgi:NitT/TauT family transport system substrate-binding protein